MSQWRVCDPRDAAGAKTVVAVADVEYFQDHMDLEGIVGRAFSDPASLDFFQGGGILVLATRRGADEMRLLAGSYGPAAEAGVRHGLLRLAREGQVVALRKLPEGAN